MTDRDIDEAYSINPYGAVIDIERCVEQMRDCFENDELEELEEGLELLEDLLPTLETAVGVRYSRETDWVPFDVQTTSDGETNIFEHDSDDTRRIRTRTLDGEIPSSDGDSV